MSMMVGFGNNGVKKISLNRASSTTAKKEKTKRKRSQYNFKELSAQLMRTRTSANAREVITRAYSKISGLKMKRGTGDYDDQELLHAIAHAEKMVRIAKKRMKHLKEEENAKKEGSPCEASLPEENQDSQIEETAPSPEELAQLEEKMLEMMRELQEEMRRMEKSMAEELSAELLSDEISSSGEVSLDPEDLELLKKKHRSEELRDIMEADLKYLKAMFDRLSKEKQENSSGSPAGYDNASGVSLELGGMEVPVQTAEIPVSAQGGSLDIIT